MPPRELPGFYFDETRNRYFPLSSKSKSASTSKLPEKLDSFPQRGEISSTSVHKILTGIQSTSSRLKRKIAMDAALVGQYTQGYHSHTEAFSDANITSLAISSINPGLQIAGDTRGFAWLRSPEHDVYGEPVENGEGIWECYMPLGSSITHVSVFMHGFLALSFGPRPKILLGAFETAKMCADRAKFHTRRAHSIVAWNVDRTSMRFQSNIYARNDPTALNARYYIQRKK
ncbi:hypothetical protein BOTBODRAFT_65014 [Botryobasidium botryosum FD-172 SS1]|uniref:Uncharacterized protein n=1 Tax=Botryobasidium botryosum (strain FD-172 SS1) TaxID=930990 RepID=A0A067MWY6_BOTB1|nr:hypothetical protein BOTBODRAFT_65014 [Botryobasidium botryosum FD-172 SS1]